LFDGFLRGVHDHRGLELVNALVDEFAVPIAVRIAVCVEPLVKLRVEELGAERVVRHRLGAGHVRRPVSVAVVMAR